eukprot:scaffold76537_cov62-Phaeocystis_antarctica.AAC.1
MTSTPTTPVRQPSSPGFARWEWSPSDTAYYAHSGVAACPPRALAYSRALRRPLSQWGDICPPNSQDRRKDGPGQRAHTRRAR